jgi:hypothetical protein
MKMDVEDVLRAALHRQADRAAPPGRVLAGMRNRARIRRRRTGIAAAASALAVAGTAVAVPFIASSGTGPPTTNTTVQPGSTTSTPGVRPTRVPVRFLPTWLPDGVDGVETGVSTRPTMVERHGGIRYFGDVGMISLNWVGGHMGMIGDMETVQINGAAGKHSVQGGFRYLQWRPEPGTTIQLTVREAVGKQDALRIANSVRPSAVVVEVPMELGWIPADLDRTGGQVHVAGTAVELAVDAGMTSRSTGSQGSTSTAEPPPSQVRLEPARSLSATVAPTTDAPAGGEPVTVNGRPGRYLEVPEQSELRGIGPTCYLVVELGDGRTLTVVGKSVNVPVWTRADLLRVAEAVRVGPNPDVSGLAIP